jgi:hypothetical protein
VGAETRRICGPESLKKPPANATIECSVCGREIPEKEYYATHVNLHPCE